ncbi:MULTISPECIES: signal peptidase II [Frankia]|uniref:signal peptidase II n=1 Tax=Frankia TaxID=1854 RepID=UPI0012FF985C|nr:MULTISPECIES: signal peptidase II [Frankia]
MGAETTIGSSVSEDPADRGSAATGGAAGTARRPVVTLTVAALVILLLDIVTKHLAVATLSDRGPVDIIPGVLDLRLTRNSGAAFSLAGGATVVLSLVALAVISVVVFTARRLRSVAWAVVLGALLGGALGNLTDRIFRAPGPLRGHVVDFVYLHHWPIFNAADSAIVCGGVLAVVLSLRGIGLDGTRYGDPDPDPDPAAATGGVAASGVAVGGMAVSADGAGAAGADDRGGAAVGGDGGALRAEPPADAGRGGTGPGGQ